MTDWTDPAWVAEAHEWIRDRLGARGTVVVGSIAQEHVRQRGDQQRRHKGKGDRFGHAQLGQGVEEEKGGDRDQDATQQVGRKHRSSQHGAALKPPHEQRKASAEHIAAKHRIAHGVGQAERRDRRVKGAECGDADGCLNKRAERLGRQWRS